MGDKTQELSLLISSDHLAERNSWPDMVRRAKTLGFAGMEIFGTDIVDGPLASASATRKLRDLAQETGMALTVHPWFDWTEIAEKKAINEGLELLERCANLGATSVNMHLNFLATPGVGCTRAAYIVRSWLEQLEEYGQTLYFENVPDYLPNPLGSNPDEFKEFLGLLDKHPNVRLTIDVGHANICGNLNEFVTDLGVFWGYTHIADNLGEIDDHLGPGTGSVDWDNFTSLVRTSEYKGVFVCEFSERFLPKSEQVLAQAFANQGRKWPKLSYDVTQGS